MQSEPDGTPDSVAGSEQQPVIEDYQVIESMDRRLSALEKQPMKPDKDFWDRLHSVSTIISGLCVVLIGFYATNVYDRHSKIAAREIVERNTIATEIQTVEKFFPYLYSTNESQKEGAILSISALGNTALATRLAASITGAGAQRAITQIYRQLSGSVVNLRVQVGSTSEIRQFSGAVTKNSGEITTVCWPFQHIPNTSVIKASIASQPNKWYDVVYVSTDNNKCLSSLKIPLGGDNIAAFSLSNEKIKVGQAVTVLGFQTDQDVEIIAGLINFVSAENVAYLDKELNPRFAGAPVVDSKGNMIGLVRNNRPGIGSYLVSFATQ